MHVIGSGQSFLYTNLRHQHIFKRMFTKLSIIILSRIAKFYLRILATSVSSERAFHAAGKIVCAQRASLRGDNVEMLIFLKSNLRVFSNLCKKKITWIWQILCKSRLKNHSDEWLFDKTNYFVLFIVFIIFTWHI